MQQRNTWGSKQKQRKWLIQITRRRKKKQQRDWKVNEKKTAKSGCGHGGKHKEMVKLAWGGEKRERECNEKINYDRCQKKGN